MTHTQTHTNIKLMAHTYTNTHTQMTHTNDTHTVKTRCWCVIMPDRYTFVRCGVDDMASVDINEKVIAAKEISTQHRPVHISQHERPRIFAEAKVE